jgi:hypothetical protein
MAIWTAWPACILHSIVLESWQPLRHLGQGFVQYMPDDVYQSGMQDAWTTHGLRTRLNMICYCLLPKLGPLKN